MQTAATGAVTAGITTRPTSLLTRLFCLGPKPLSQLLAEQQVRLLALARVPFSEEDPMHFRLLASIYANLTGKAGQQPARTGQHWAELGFQGMDPATDLRGCGILGLLQAVREGRLNSPASSLGSMVEAANRMYVGAMFWFYRTWRGGNKTMSQSGFVMKELEAQCHSKAAALAKGSEALLS
ncbi:ELMO domain-containing protein, partial [Haematococcus lacustris]